MTTPVAKQEFDLILVVCGTVIGFATPVAIISRIHENNFSSLEVLDVLSDQPFFSVPALLLAVAGFTFVSVGLNGHRGKYADGAERFDAIYTTAAATAIVCMGAFSLLLALSTVVAFVEYRDVRVLATIVGALVGMHLSGHVAGSSSTPPAFALAGGLMGYLAAPALLLFLGVAALLLFGGPLITWMMNFPTNTPPRASSPPPKPIDNRQQILDLQAKIDFVRKSGVAPHLIQEEVDKLNKKIATLGATL